MGIKTGDINNEKGKAKIGHDFKNSEIDSETLGIEVGDINNTEGDLDLGNKADGVKAGKSKNRLIIGVLAAIPAIIYAIVKILEVINN